MDGWTGYCLTQCQFWFYKKNWKNGEGYQTEYLEGTAMAWEKSEYLEGGGAVLMM
jgi:hypothetical protein